VYDILSEIRDLFQTNIGSSINKYYVGKLKEIPVNYLPVMCVYGTSTSLLSRSTSRERFEHSVTIEVFTSPFNKVSTAEPSNNAMQAQKELYDIMEERTSGVPKNTTVLGVLSRNINGTNFLFSDQYSIDYSDFDSDDRQYFKATITINVQRAYNNRN